MNVIVLNNEYAEFAEVWMEKFEASSGQDQSSLLVSRINRIKFNDIGLKCTEPK